MFQFLSFIVSDLDGSNPTTCTLDYVNERVSLGGPTVAFGAALENQASAILALTEQDPDSGTVVLAIQATGGPVVSYVPATETAPAKVRPHDSLPGAWSFDKANGYLEALTAIGLLP